MLRSLFVDFNSYFASVEQQENPALRGRPIAVVPVMADTTCAIAASYEAKAFGVTTGTMIGEAKERCPDLVLVQARHGIYIDYHHRLVEAVESVIHVKKVMSVDEMECELLGSMRDRAKATALGEAVKRTIAERVGTEMRCSIGIAPNGYLAKTASDMMKPDGLVVIDDADLPHGLHRLELRDLCGVGKRMHERLRRKGIYTVEQLCAAPIEHLRTVWGGIEGERMWHRLRGHEVAVADTHRSSVSHSHVLEPSLRTVEGAHAVLHRLLQKAAMRMRMYGMVTGHMAIGIRHRDGQRFRKDIDFTATQDSIQLTAILAKALLDHTIDGQPLKVSVVLDDLIPASAAPVPMFDHTGPSRESLNASLDALNARYGKNTVYVGSAHDGRNSAPMRIAFNHIPDLETDDES